MRLSLPAVLVVLALGASAAPLAAQDDFEILPDSVTPGDLVALTIRAPEGRDVVGGRVAGEPLHLHPVAGGLTAWAAVPLDAADSIGVDLAVRRRFRTDTVRVMLAVRSRAYRERALRVAPGMARPDTAMQARIRAEVARAYALADASHHTPRLDAPPFLLPRESRASGAFGDARTFNGEVRSRHLGLDLAGGVGAPVRAPGRGVVALVDEFYLGGTVVYLDHGEGLTTGYLHLSAALVATGDTVEAGQLIGRVGRSGRATGPHLHWVMRYGSIAVDPMSAVRPD